MPQCPETRRRPSVHSIVFRRRVIVAFHNPVVLSPVNVLNHVRVHSLHYLSITSRLSVLSLEREKGKEGVQSPAASGSRLPPPQASSLLPSFPACSTEDFPSRAHLPRACPFPVFLPSQRGPSPPSPLPRPSGLFWPSSSFLFPSPFSSAHPAASSRVSRSLRLHNHHDHPPAQLQRWLPRRRSPS